MARRLDKARAAKDPEQIRERILRAFSERARRSGTRSVIMAELASELRMSATTLYHHFASKEDLVIALVERWACEVADSAEPAHDAESPVDDIVHWAEAWASSVSRYAPVFWEDLRRDHPGAWKIFLREIRRWKATGAIRLRPHLRPDLHPEMALATLDVLLRRVPDPRLCESLGISRRQATETAIRIWARGALQRRGTPPSR